MEREAFRQAGNEKIRIRFSFRIPKIVVGFGDSNTLSEQKFPTKLSKDRKTYEAELRLDDFGDYPAIKKPLRKAMDLRVKLKVKDSDIIFPIVRIPPDPRPKPKPKPTEISIEIGKGCSLRELEKAEEELAKESEEKPNAGLMIAVEGLKEVRDFANSLPPPKSSDWWIKTRIGDVWVRILVDPRRESMRPENVEKLKAFFKKHFGENNHA